ncbi:HAD family hydrolase [Chloroflexi bacterium TSY]|nr:HAD family hydrolase [Chloroflexi bacterium TSY]
MIDAIFLDRDGVINRERKDYVKSWPEFDYLPGARTALRQLGHLQCPIFIVTNQSAIGRGLVLAKTVNEIHQHIQHDVQKLGSCITEFFVCPHHPDAGCGCRKPQPGLILKAAKKYQLHLTKCLMIGDSITDMMAGQSAGCCPIFVRSGRQGATSFQKQELDFMNSVHLFSDLRLAVDHILKQIDAGRR